MSLKTNVQATIQEMLGSDEPITACELAEIKVTTKTDVAKNIAKSIALTAVTAPLGLTSIANTVQPIAWVVVTNKRLIIVATDYSKKKIGEVIFNAQLNEVSVVDTSKIIKSIGIKNAQTDELLVRLVFRIQYKACKNIKSALGAL